MKKYFNLCSLLAATIALTINFTACNSLEPEDNYPSTSSTKGRYHSAEIIAEPLDDGTNPEENVLTFKITPEDGWEVHPGEIILFQAWLINETTGEYVEVTNSSDCKFYSAQFGKSVNGDDPSLTNGQEITIRAVYKGWGAQTTGTFRAN